MSRQRNEKIVLRLIHSSRERGLSQSEVVLATGLKPPTIFRIFSYLEEAGYIMAVERPLLAQGEEEVRQERKGRRPQAYVARKETFYSLGVEFWVERVSLGIFDFQGNSVYSTMVPLTRKEDAEAVTDLIARLVEEAIASLHLPQESILGLGLGAPGQVSVGVREVVYYPRIPGMKDFPIAARLEARLGLPVSIHNNLLDHRPEPVPLRRPGGRGFHVHVPPPGRGQRGLCGRRQGVSFPPGHHDRDGPYIHRL